MAGLLSSSQTSSCSIEHLVYHQVLALGGSSAWNGEIHISPYRLQLSHDLLWKPLLAGPNILRTMSPFPQHLAQLSLMVFGWLFVAPTRLEAT